MRRLLALVLCLLPLSGFAAIQVDLVPSVGSPQPVGTPVILVATATDPNPGILAYRYTVSEGGASRIVRDFSQTNSLELAGVMVEGDYTVQVTVRNNETHETAQTSVDFQFTSRVANGQPVVSATANPLVALFSAPPCPRGSRMRVRFRSLATAHATDWRPCDPQSSMNFYIAGMTPKTPYSMAAQTSGGRGGTTTSAALYFTTGAGPSNLPVVTPVLPGNAQSSLVDNVLLSDFLTSGTSTGYPIATDLYGHPIWYYGAFNKPLQGGGLLVRGLPGGNMLVLANGTNSSTRTRRFQILREIDLEGNALRETNATRIQEQLAAMGLQSSCVAGGPVCAFSQFHHDAIRLPNGHTIAFGIVERMFPAGTQGSPTPVDIVGDMLVDLDENFQVVWYWDAFDHLDVNRAAVLGETCSSGAEGCPVLFLASVANDWLHGNSIQYTSDHNLVVSLRHQDWVIKIDYQDGAGTGDVIWRLGHDGDFSIVSTDAWPWFSHQHDAGFESNGTFTVFDDGNTRVVDNPGTPENSRGQVYQIDENNMVATLVVNSDLGVYSPALGSAQLLSNGNYHFLPGFNSPGPAEFSQSVEVLPNGTVNMRLQASPIAYRSFRMKSLYAPPGT
jgi:hypothetical protein